MHIFEGHCLCKKKKTKKPPKTLRFLRNTKISNCKELKAFSPTFLSTQVSPIQVPYMTDADM